MGSSDPRLSGVVKKNGLSPKQKKTLFEVFDNIVEADIFALKMIMGDAEQHKKDLKTALRIAPFLMLVYVFTLQWGKVKAIWGEMKQARKFMKQTPAEITKPFYDEIADLRR